MTKYEKLVKKPQEKCFLPELWWNGYHLSIIQWFCQPFSIWDLSQTASSTPGPQHFSNFKSPFFCSCNHLFFISRLLPFDSSHLASIFPKQQSRYEWSGPNPTAKNHAISMAISEIEIPCWPSWQVLADPERTTAANNGPDFFSDVKHRWQKLFGVSWWFCWWIKSQTMTWHDLASK